ncbi:MAG: (2Fe-2S)-binding protein [Candidatus Hydrothermae bacterium]|nr:(2Fe-2S)-binding protein [Candidatus Hydrothermae bacterium]
MKKLTVNFTVNGKKVRLRVPANRTLLDILREDLGLTGTKRGCDTGECGACTVLMNGRSVNSCLVLAGEVEGAEIITVEGLGGEEALHPLQEAFLEEDAVQCGFCIPGMLMSAKYLLDRNPDPSEEEIREAISGNLCRCTGYIPIIRAIKRAALKLKESK